MNEKETFVFALQRQTDAQMQLLAKIWIGFLCCVVAYIG
jgi:hypothetical protein